MAPSTIRQALGAVKDQTSIGLAKVSSNISPDLDVAIIKATSHDDDPADEKYIREIISFTAYSRAYVNACVSTISKRLGKTRDWIVALKGLMLVHRLLVDGDPSFQQEFLHATRRGTRLLNMSDFRDEAHSHSWDHSAFVRTYALYLDQRLEWLLFENKRSNARQNSRERSKRSDYYGEDYDNGHSYNDSGDRRERAEERSATTPLREVKMERIFARMHYMQQVLDRFLACRPTGAAKNSRLVLIALYPAVRESFQLYADICEILAVLLDRFFDMEYQDCVKAFEAYNSAAKQIDELGAFYNWCKDIGVARSSEYPHVQRITDKLLETLEEFMRDRSHRPKSPERPREEERAPAQTPPPPQEEEPIEEDMNSIKALPAPADFQPQPEEPPKKQETGDLLNLAEDVPSADDQGNRLALALFSGPPANKDTWEAFPSNSGQEVTSAWQTPLAEAGKADWELALVESASNLSKQKATLAGGFDPLLLDGMYDQGASRQVMSAYMSTGGSASSVALPNPDKLKTGLLALPAPTGTPVAEGLRDPFAASLTVPPPSYVQMADIEKKQQLLVQEQMIWQQYARDGMQGQVGLARVATTNPSLYMPYGMPPANGHGYGPYPYATAPY
ncbi:probable clathrin assembly protein At4g32285 [Nymphaea colorata]|uniref:probable clathrin assembly protein At4g32285 n=1 Tax=Nymphaea colorata TaxID=210225 RepID=UPI00129E9793|nr:probable clathrin assembly protein At4g32285 [Nymphaea colorata]